ncbi:hypothetical protein Tc00.1047053503775.60 [Trypanosoma cruzi]|uniref:Uncharacterized protein n=1 Tax=Trypanosoma cruzi (strain CL Brener) TaxID=353153 RepID=Q4CUR2_TRYCC|nr:hypothetical protein Tc00.1047053503775.60 [Trypanosoma cruzi]EAN84014.1 hypothetical protein Tc00.1047053503775.60 [Trypanosoma cruzi]|eukprot:XP_805865.1 hypothetical protein [Trypanosoma cruzi strain CL Brener]
MAMLFIHGCCLVIWFFLCCRFRVRYFPLLIPLFLLLFHRLMMVVMAIQLLVVLMALLVIMSVLLSASMVMWVLYLSLNLLLWLLGLHLPILPFFLLLFGFQVAFFLFHYLYRQRLSGNFVSTPAFLLPLPVGCVLTKFLCMLAIITFCLSEFFSTSSGPPATRCSNSRSLPLRS